MASNNQQCQLVTFCSNYLSRYSSKTLPVERQIEITKKAITLKDNLIALTIT